MPNPDSSNRDRRQRNRRRPRRQPGMRDTTVPSPCLSVCRFDGEPYCVGCYRNADEIREWMIMTREEKLAVLAQLPGRKNSDSGSSKYGSDS
ncbi:MAG: DUF1289 domain-containing protein [Acidiferrobacterales bacterium]|nr:DUF1289 domain-containing protein [Acidiferrobacterales bacterium]